MARRRKISSYRIWVCGTIQMEGAEHKVAVGKPSHGATVKFLPTRPQYRGIDTFMDERMSEEVVVAFGPYQVVLDQPRAHVGRVVE